MLQNKNNLHVKITPQNDFRLVFYFTNANKHLFSKCFDNLFDYDCVSLCQTIDKNAAISYHQLIQLTHLQ